MRQLGRCVSSAWPAGLALPERMAELNALLDVAAPAMREALQVAFLDRLQRPSRGVSRG